MDPQLIKALIEALAASDLSELHYSAGGETLRLVKQGGSLPSASAPQAAEAPAVPAAVRPAQPEQAATQLVTAPLYGIVHLQRSPDAAPLVTPGDAVDVGQVLCLIEAMKVFAELRAERAGTIDAVLVTAGQEVEAGQPLFRIVCG
jgi:acetyl-CoA carboxylase biotin carboxyl carrier protein